MTPKVLSRKIKTLSIKAPMTASYSAALIERGIWSNERVWYTTQKEHWLGWLSEYDGPGAYGRKTVSGRSADPEVPRIQVKRRVCPDSKTD